MKESRIYFFPIKALLFFLIFTEILLFVGPRDYDIKSPFLLILYFIFINYVLYTGFVNGVFIQDRKVPKYRKISINSALLSIIILMGFVAILIRFISGLGASNLSVSNLINTLLYSVVNSGEAYSAKLESASVTSLTYIIMFLEPFSYMAKTIGVYYWKRVPFLFRIILLLQIILEVVLWLGLGTRKGLGDLMILLLFILIASHPDIFSKGKGGRKYTFVFIALLVLFLYYFVISNMSRSGLSSGEILEMKTGAVKPFYIEHVSPYLYIPFCQINGYLCQGYYALSCALDAFVHGKVCWSYGFGSNWFKINVMEHLVPNVSVLSSTYQAYLEKTYEISPLVNWHSIYVWLANDVTFPGTFFIVYYIGKWFGRVWVCAVNGINDYAIPMVGLFALMIFYFFANNQVLSFSFIAFWVLFLLYIFKEYKFRW